LSDAQNVARVEAAKEMSGILQESETNGLTASQQATSHGFSTPCHPRKYLPVRQQMSFRGRGRQLARTNYDHGVLHRKEIDCVRCFFQEAVHSINHILSMTHSPS
jgi:hypothetical protein